MSSLRLRTRLAIALGIVLVVVLAAVTPAAVQRRRIEEARQDFVDAVLEEAAKPIPARFRAQSSGGYLGRARSFLADELGHVQSLTEGRDPQLRLGWQGVSTMAVLDVLALQLGILFCVRNGEVEETAISPHVDEATLARALAALRAAPTTERRAALVVSLERRIRDGASAQPIMDSIVLSVVRADIDAVQSSTDGAPRSR